MSLENNSGKKLCYISGPAHANDAKPKDGFEMSLENNSGKKLCYISGPAHANDASKEVTNQ